ncbi:MAG: carbohydrate porin [Methylacidiphilales bacterium]|nr:carbohydrate porin [Candidatus Methylacidiphilales bacterium]
MKPRALLPTRSFRAPGLLFGATFGLLISTGPAVGAGTDDKEIIPVTAQQKQTSLGTQQYLFGDWGGERTDLANEGITFDFNNIGDFLVNVSGSEVHHATYFGRFRGSTDIDFNKLSGFDGEFFFSGIWQYGENLSADYLHTNTLTSSIAGANSVRIDQLWYQMGFFNHKFLVKLGQVAAVNEFGATDFFDILVNDELGYAPNAVFNTKIPFSPAGKPGIILKGDLSDLTPGLYVKAGVFTAYDDPYHPDTNGVNYINDFDYGLSGAFEIGYNEQNTHYAGVYKVGMTWNPDVAYTNPATGQLYHGDYNGYATVEKTVYHPAGADGKPDIKKGLDLLFEFVGAPGDRNPLQYEFTTGGRYTGLIPGRDQDKLGFGLIYSNNGSAYSQANSNSGGPGLGGETTLELDYQYNPAPWFSIQPDAQFIIDPGGNSDRSSILVLGLRTIVRF